MPSIKDIQSQADQYVSEFNKRYLTEGICPVLQELSVKLCTLLDQSFPRINQTGQPMGTPTMENLMWAKGLIVASWIGWVLQSKAIQHYGKPHPEEIELLHVIIPSIVEAFEVGKRRAREEKRVTS